MTNYNPQFQKIGDILIHDGCIDESQLSEQICAATEDEISGCMYPSACNFNENANS